MIRCLQAGGLLTELPMPTPEGLCQVNFAARGTRLCCLAPGSQSALQPSADWRLVGCAWSRYVPLHSCSRRECSRVDTMTRYLQAGRPLTELPMPTPEGPCQVNYAMRGTILLSFSAES